MKESSKKKLVMSTWAGDVEKKGKIKNGQETDAQKVEGKWRQGRQKLRWGIALKVGEECKKN